MDCVLGELTYVFFYAFHNSPTHFQLPQLLSADAKVHVLFYTSAISSMSLLVL
jgi:hypothetical protein